MLYTWVHQCFCPKTLQKILYSSKFLNFFFGKTALKQQVLKVYLSKFYGLIYLFIYFFKDQLEVFFFKKKIYGTFLFFCLLVFGSYGPPGWPLCSRLVFLSFFFYSNIYFTVNHKKIKKNKKLSAVSTQFNQKIRFFFV